jgi:hypothetical protein
MSIYAFHFELRRDIDRGIQGVSKILEKTSK